MTQLENHTGYGIERVLRPVEPSGGYPTGMTTKRKTWKWFGGSVGTTWAGRGKWYKRRLSKSRRQYYEAIDNGRKPRGGFINASREANWKGW